MDQKLKFEDLQVGLVVWWHAERYMNAWSCPGQISQIDTTARTFRVRTFDDYSESGDLSGAGEAMREFRPAVSAEVEEYLARRSEALDDEVTRAKRTLDRITRKRDRWHAKEATS